MQRVSRPVAPTLPPSSQASRRASVANHVQKHPVGKGGTVPRPNHRSLPLMLKWIFAFFIFCIRIGEATNPGPILGTTNPCGALGKGELYTQLPGEEQDSQVWGIAESHLTTPGLNRFRQELKHQGKQWKVAHGAPAPPLTQSIGTIGGKAAGVAILSNCPIRTLTTDWDNDTWKTARTVACAVHIQSAWLKIGCFYGYARDAHTKATKEKTDKLLATLTDRIVLQARGLRAIVGDFNATTEDLAQFQTWKEHGFRELQEIAMSRWGQQIETTCKGTSTKDHVWVSAELAQRLESVHVDSTVFPDHAIVFGKFAAFGSFIPAPIWYKPHKIPWKDIPRDYQWPEIGIQGNSIPEIFSGMEDQVDMALRTAGKNGLLGCQKGRGQTVKPKIIRHEIPPVRPSRKAEYQIQYHGESHQHVKWVRQLRRLQSLCKLLKCPRENPHTIAHKRDLWNAIRGAPGFPGGFPKMWINRIHVIPQAPMHLPKRVPTEEEADHIFTAFQVEFQALESALNKHRKDRAKSRRVDDPNVIYQDVSNQRALPVQTVVLKTHATVTEVRDDGATIIYEPHVFKVDQEVHTHQGHLLTKEHQPGVLSLSQEAAIEVGDALLQSTMHGSSAEVFQAFIDLWEPMWTKHANCHPTRWDTFASKLIEYAPKVTIPMTIVPITSCEWKDNVRAKKASTATGPDGVSREDLLEMPGHLTDQLVERINLIDQGFSEWPTAAMVGHITAVEKRENAMGPQDYRPITVLTTTYRTWSSIRAKQCLTFLDAHAPSGLKGNRPGHDTSSIWWQIAQEIEAAHHANQPLSGFVTDVCKCFNNLARPVVFASAIHFGLPIGFVKTWHRAIGKIQRHFIVDGKCSDPVFACTGYPEGDPLSVVAMVLVNFSMHIMVEQMVQPIKTISFVDNWEVRSSDVKATCDAFQYMQEYADMIDVTLDVAKTSFWAVCPQDRAYLRENHKDVVNHIRDLGGQLNFTRRFSNQTIRARLAKIKSFWSMLSRSCAPQEHKLRAICTVAWPRCLHAVSTVALGIDHITKLRAAIMTSMKWDKKGASSVLQCLQMPPNCDPQYYILAQTIMMFRQFCVPDQMFPVLTALVLSPPKHFDPGPAGVFLSRLHQLNWRWDHGGWIHDHENITWHILDAPIQLIKSRLQHAWAKMLGSQMSTRQEFEGLGMVDVHTTLSTMKAFPADSQGLLRTTRNGTFYTRNKQIHAGKVPSKICPFCTSEDSVKHRVWECEAFQLLRTLPDSTVRYLEHQPPCTTLHGWMVEDGCDQRFRQALQGIPDLTGTFQDTPALPEVLHLFTDGGCLQPTVPQLRLGTWSVSVATLSEGKEPEFVPVAAGGTPGLFQTTLRAEITAAISAFRFGLWKKKQFYIWTDNQTVFDRIVKFAQKESRSPSNKRNDHDLWSQLHFLVQQAQHRQLYQRVVKVFSHQDSKLLSDVVEKWASRGNDHADHQATLAFHHLPSEVQQAWTKFEVSLSRRREVVKQFHSMMMNIAIQSVEAKTVYAQQDQRKWEEAPKPDGEEETISLAGLARVLQPPQVHTLGRCLEPLHAWLVQLTTAGNAVPIWLCSYQLFLHFQATTSTWGFQYDPKTKEWDLADSFVDAEGYNFLKLAGWHMAIIKTYARVMGLECEAKSRMPWGGAFRAWQRCIRVMASPEQFFKVEELFKEVGAHGTKSVTRTLGRFPPMLGRLT